MGSFCKISLGVLNIIILVLLCLYIHNLPYLPLKYNYTKLNPEVSRNEVFDVLDSQTGALTHKGWARYPNKMLYDPKMAQSCRVHRKFWNYYYVIHENYLVTMAHVDLGIAKASYINVRDIKNPSAPTIEVKVEDHFSRYVNIESERNGGGVFSTVNAPNLNMTFFGRANEHTANINISGSHDKGTLVGNFELNTEGLEGITYLNSPENDPSKHFYGIKIPLIKFVGSLSFNNKPLFTCSKAKPCLGLTDIARNHLPYVYNWIWVSSCFEVGTQKVAINMGNKIDDPNSSYDSVYIDGKLYKLDYMVMTEHNGVYKWTQAPGANQYGTKLELEFVKNTEHHLKKNLGVIFVDLNASYGHFKGKITTEDGKVISFNNVFGFIEDNHSRW